MKKNDKNAISPVVSTVLLIMFVVIIALIILIWARGFYKESILKEVGGEKKNIQQFCSEISLTPIINNDGTFGFRNIGNVPIYAFKLKLISKNTGASEIKTIKDRDGLTNPGFSKIITDVMSYDSYEEIYVIPILLGKSGGGYQEFVCPEINSFRI